MIFAPPPSGVSKPRASATATVEVSADQVGLAAADSSQSAGHDPGSRDRNGPRAAGWARTVPGFEDAPVAIAVLEDGTQLVLNRAADGSTRVAGTYSGTFPRVQVKGEWAVTAAPGRCTVLRRNPGGAVGQ